MSDAPPRGRGPGARSRKGSGAVALCLIAVALLAIPLPTSWVEAVYSQGLYRWLQPPIATISSLVPIALHDLLLLSVLALTLWWIGSGLRRPRLEGFRSLARLATLSAALLLYFALTWGLNFRRARLNASEAFDPTRVTPAAVRALAARAVRTLNETYAQLPATWPGDAAMHAALAGPFGDAAEELAGWRPVLASAKPSLVGWYMPRVGINGYYLSWFHEIAVNPELLAFERPYVVAHEWGHALGYATESEAAYVGWLACDRGPPWARYSAWMRVLDYVLGDLERDERRAAVAELAPGVRRDLIAREARARRHFRPGLRRVAKAVEGRVAAVGRVDPSQRDYDLLVQLILGLGPSSPDRVEMPVGAPEVRDTVRDHR